MSAPLTTIFPERKKSLASGARAGVALAPLAPGVNHTNKASGVRSAPLLHLQGTPAIYLVHAFPGIKTVLRKSVHRGVNLRSGQPGGCERLIMDVS